MKIDAKRVGIFDLPDIVNKTSAQPFYLVVQGLTPKLKYDTLISKLTDTKSDLNSVQPPAPK